MYPLTTANEASVAEATAPKTEEQRLVEAAKGGDSAAFEALVERNKRLVLAITRRITGNTVDAEDLSQQAFMKAFANLSRFAGRCSFATWLVSIAMNEARMWYRKARRSREVSMSDLSTGETFETTPLEFTDWRPNPEVTCAQRESGQMLSAAMDRLKPGMRDALQLCDLEERSTMAAAVLLGISVNALKSRRLRGRLALRRKLESSLSRKNRRTRNSTEEPMTDSDSTGDMIAMPALAEQRLAA
jgi:RNA polymerase sigma-70 factor (ECF subfamily)